MRMKLSSLLAAALLAGTCSYALAQTGGGGGGASGGGAGSDISAPRLNSGPGGTAGQTGAMKMKNVHFNNRKHHRHRHHHRHHHRM